MTDQPEKPSHYVPKYLQAQGYRVIPVNPTIETALGERSYPSLRDVPDRIDILTFFGGRNACLPSSRRLSPSGPARSGCAPCPGSGPDRGHGPLPHEGAPAAAPGLVATRGVRLAVRRGDDPHPVFSR